MATIIAMIAPISTVPQNSGIPPNVSSTGAPLVGAQLVPKSSSAGETRRKKRIDSKSSDSTMPKVVRIATSDASSNSSITIFSTRVRARKSGRMRVKA